MKIHVIGSPNERCGIAEHTGQMAQALRLVGHDVSVFLPDYVHVGSDKPEVVILNHHAALHSMWTRERVAELQTEVPVVVIQHDTFETRAIMDERGLPDFDGAAELVLVHEEVVKNGDSYYGTVFPMPIPTPLSYPIEKFHSRRVALVGFDFPWKNFERVREIGRAEGFDVVTFPGQWGFIEHTDLLSSVASCWGAVFFYTCGNSGQSGAIGVGLAAKIPVWAYASCRQFRQLHEDRAPIHWGMSEVDLAAWFRGLERIDDWLVTRSRWAEAFCWRRAVEELDEMLTLASQRYYSDVRAEEAGYGGLLEDELL